MGDNFWYEFYRRLYLPGDFASLYATSPESSEHLIGNLEDLAARICAGVCVQLSLALIFNHVNWHGGEFLSW